MSDGCINGVMRRHLLENIPGAGYEIKEKPIVIADLQSADEIFLTNAIYWYPLGESNFNKKTLEINTLK